MSDPLHGPRSGTLAGGSGREPAAATAAEYAPARPPPVRAWAGAARVAFLAGADTAALILAGLLAVLLWAQPVRGQELALYLPLAPAALLIVLGYGQAGLYPGFGLGPVEVLRRYCLVTATAFLAMAALVFVLKLQDVYSRVTLTLAFVLGLTFVGGIRWVITRLARRSSWWAEPVVVAGVGPRGALTRAVLGEDVASEFRAVGEVHLPADGAEAAALGRFVEEVSRYAEAGIRVAFADLAGPGAETALDRLRLLFPRVVILRDFQELPVEGVQVRNLGGVLGLEYGNNLLRRQSRWVKRALDIAVAVPALVLTLPVMLPAIVAVKILSRGPALFRHPREGRRGRVIQVPKIRTMVVDAERRMEELLRSDPEARAEWEAKFKLRDDPRVIPVVGRVLRRLSIDELPQLWSVVLGDMSLVGPRPFPPYHLDALSDHARRLRGEVRPGITGLWQVNARGVADVKTQQAYDMYYIRNWSVWVDLHILARTVWAVLSGRGAH